VFIPDSTYTADDVLLPRTTVELIIDGDDFSDYYLGYDLGVSSRGQQATGTIRLKDRDGALANKVSQFDQSFDKWLSHNMTDERTISLTVTQGEKVTDYPVLLPGVPSWDNDGTLSWAVTDLTPLLNKDNQSATDVVWDEQGVDDNKSVSDIVATLATMAGVSISHTATNWDVRTWRMTAENLLSKLDDLCRPTQSYRRWDGDALILEALNEALSPAFHAIDRFHIASLTATTDDSGLRTFFKAFRLRSQASALAEPREGRTVGRVVEITFPPSDFVRIRTKQAFGVIGEGVFYSGEDEVNSTEDPQTEFYSPDAGVTKADRWLGTFTPDIGPAEYQWWWWVSAEGGVYNAADVMIEGFDFEQAVSVAEAKFGRRPEYSNLATELIREPETFAAMMAAIVLEVLWSVRRFSLSTPWLLPQREGTFMNVTHAKHRLASVKMLVNGWRHSHSWESGWNNSYDLRAKLS
jgi:hypothetical protein